MLGALLRNFMLEAVLRHLKNWFLVPNGIHTGTFVVEGGYIALPFLKPGQYFRIVGSTFNDGLHKYEDGESMREETFDGAVWALAIPEDVKKLAEEIEAWNEKNGAAAQGPYQSESFGGYTYTKASDEHGNAMTWEGAFRRRLNPYRKVREV